MRYPATILVVTLVLGIPLAGCTGVPAPEADRGAIARGEAVAAQWCATCHAIGGDTSAEYGAPGFVEIANRAQLERATLRAFLDGDHFPMTTYRLFPAERDDVAAYIASLRRQ